MVTKSIESPLAELTLRRYERPYQLPPRETVAKLCLSLGLLQPGDSRDVIIDVLYVLLQANQKSELLSSIEIRNRVVDVRKEYHLKMLGVADSNIRRQLLRLRDVMLAEKVKNAYRIAEHEHISTLLQDKILTFLLPSLVERVKEYAKVTDETFPKVTTEQ